MPKLIHPTLLLNGGKFLPKNGYSATVTMAQGGTSSFTVSFPADALEGLSSRLMDNTLEHIGGRMYLSLDDGEMEFTGLVTSIDLQRGSGASGTIVMSGQGPSALLGASVQCLSYEEGMTLSWIARETLKGHSTEVLKAVMGEGLDLNMPYTVQYNESDLSFLQRLCRRHGLWFYHDGIDLNIGRGPGKRVEGRYGTDVASLCLSTSLRAKGPGIDGHDWVNDQRLETPAGRYGAKSSHPYFGQVARESDLILAKPGHRDSASGQHAYGAQFAMDRAAKAAAHAAAAGMVTAIGSSDLTTLKVGDTLALFGADSQGESDGRSMGTYDIIAISHRFDHGGNYQNTFEAVPSGTQHPPGSGADALSTGTNASTLCPDQRGRVVDNADPIGLGRVKVQFPWQVGISQNTPWIKMPTPYSGSGKGFYFIPEKGEEVLVGFEGGDPERPFVIGAGYNASEKSGFADTDNNIKAICTRSGHTIELNDTKGGEMITINDKEGNSIHINTSEGKMVFTANGDMEFNAKNVRFNVQEDMETEIGGNKKEFIKKNYELDTKNSTERVFKNKETTIGEKLEQVSGESVVKTMKGEMLIDSKGKLTVQSESEVDYGD